jgi:hypothetical protein
MLLRVGSLRRIWAVLARHPALTATLSYAVLAVLMTWPLAAGLTHDVPSDVVDPLLNSWILAWDADHLLRFLGGDGHALAGFWDANIFFPRLRTLAYSEHLLAQAVQILPLYALTRNAILCHNLLFLSTFVLSGLGMYLLVLDLTRDRRAAYLAGLLFAFAPYRLCQIPHVQVMSSHWMPFVLLALRRYVVGGRPRAALAAAVALVAQNLSCGYFLFYFAPFAGAWALFQLACHHRLADRQRWYGLTLAALLTVALTLPFLNPYAEARIFEPLARDRGTVEHYSADLFGYLTANPFQRVWGPLLQVVPRPEGFLFPASLPLALAAAAVSAAFKRRWRAVGERSAADPQTRGAWPLRVVAAAALAVLGWELLRIGLSCLGLAWTFPSGWYFLFGHGFTEATLRATLAGIVAWWASPRVRAFASGGGRSLTVFLCLALLAAAVLSCGPTLTTLGHRLWVDAPYEVLYRRVPGFDGLRVPARLAMVVVLFLSVLAGLGARGLRRESRRGDLLFWGVGLLFLVESAIVPMRVNGTWSGPGLWRPTPVASGSVAPALYRYVDAALPRQAVLLELPIGDIPYDTRAVFHSTFHWRRLVNGFSGHIPASYTALAAALSAMPWDMQRGSAALERSGATHVIVHEGAWRRNRGRRTTTALVARGLRPLARFGDDVVLELPRRNPKAR